MVLEWFQWSVAEWVLTSVLGLFFFLQLYFYLRYFRGVPRHAKRVATGKTGVSSDQPPVSVIITTRDQEYILSRQLPLILEQDYPEFQVVVVNNASSDDTDDLLKNLEAKYPHLYHTFVPAGVQNISTKKMALTVGIKAAKYEHLLFTEANCIPSGNQWIASVMRQFVPGVSVVLSYSRYEKLKGVFSKLIAYDNLFQGMRFLGMAAMRKPYMGVGRNLAYRKELFFSQKGFASHLNLNSGEDDLFISDVAKRNNTRVEVSPEVVMNIATEDAKSHWKEARINQIYTSAYYKPMARLRNGVEICSRYLFAAAWVAVIVLASLNANLPLLITGAVVFLARFLVQLIVINQTAKALGEKRVFISILLYDLFLPVYGLLLRFDRMYHRRKSYTMQILH